MRKTVLALWQRTFLRNVLLRDRLLGVGFVIFFLGQSIAQLGGFEVTPFFLFGMYSEVRDTDQDHVRVTCLVNDAPLTQADLPRNAGELFFSTMYRLEALERSNYGDRFEGLIAEKFGYFPEATRQQLARRLSFHPEDLPAFNAWTERYLSSVRDEAVHSVKLGRETYRYVDHSPVLISAVPVRTTYLRVDAER